MAKIRIGEYLWASKTDTEIVSKRKTLRWNITNADDEFLGCVSWHGPWRQYCFFVQPRCSQYIFHNGCLRDIAAFLDRCNADQRAKAAARRQEKVQR